MFRLDSVGPGADVASSTVSTPIALPLSHDGCLAHDRIGHMIASGISPAGGSIVVSEGTFATMVSDAAVTAKIAAAEATSSAVENASRLTPLHEHELLVFWVQLLVLAAVARFLGYLMFRIGLPSVIGHLVAGVILGPSVLGKVWAEGFQWLIPEDVISSGALFAVTWLGVALLLVTAGFETDLELIRRLGRAAMLVTGFSLFVPLIAGLVTGFFLPDVFVGEGTDRSVFAMFIAAALSVSALAVIARLLSELGLMRRDFGQITVAAGMANDVVGWVMLAVFSGFATGGISVSGTLKTVLGLVAFLAIAMTIGQRVVDYCLKEVLRTGSGIPGAVSVVVFTMLVFGVITQALGIEAVLGAFVAGVILHRSRFQQHEVINHIESLTHAFLAPVFFAIAGMRVDLALLAEGEAFRGAVAVVVVAIVAKFIGSVIGAKLAGQSNRAALALGAGLNARGALEIVIASVGLSLGVFSTASYTVIVVVPLITSVFAAASLKVIVRDWRGSADEMERLEREEVLGRNLVVRSQRLMLASRANPASIAASQILHFAWPEEVPVTVVSVDTGGSKVLNDLRAAAQAVLTVGVDAPDVDDYAPGAAEEGSMLPDITVIRNVFHDRVVDQRVLENEDVARAIVEESKLGYGVICVGVAGRYETQLYSPMVDELLMRSALPILIVRRARGLSTPLPAAFARVVVPVTGTRSSRAAQEVAVGVSSRLGTQIVLTHVMSSHGIHLPRALTNLGRMGAELIHHGHHGESGSGSSEGGYGNYGEETPDVVRSLMDRAYGLCTEMGVTPETHVREGVSPGLALVEAVTEVEADLVVLGASLRNVDGRPFLGQTVETVLENCDANVVVLSIPRGSRSHGST